MPLPFYLVQKLYDAGFPYPWITWEGRLWEDPENQPNLEDILKACGKECSGLRQSIAAGDTQWTFLNKEGDYALPFSESARMAAAQGWLYSTRTDLPRRKSYVDMPVELKD